MGQHRRLGEPKEDHTPSVSMEPLQMLFSLPSPPLFLLLVIWTTPAHHLSLSLVPPLWRTVPNFLPFFYELQFSTYFWRAGFRFHSFLAWPIVDEVRMFEEQINAGKASGKTSPSLQTLHLIIFADSLCWVMSCLHRCWIKAWKSTGCRYSATHTL